MVSRSAEGAEWGYGWRVSTPPLPGDKQKGGLSSSPPSTDALRTLCPEYCLVSYVQRVDVNPPSLELEPP